MNETNGEQISAYVWFDPAWFDPTRDIYNIKFRIEEYKDGKPVYKRGFQLRLTKEWMESHARPIPEAGEYPAVTVEANNIDSSDIYTGQSREAYLKEKYDYHGGPYDRGSADSYYQRGRDPHKYPEGTYRGNRVEKEDLTPEELEAYYLGFQANEKEHNFKIW